MWAKLKEWIMFVWNALKVGEVAPAPQPVETPNLSNEALDRVTKLEKRVLSLEDDLKAATFEKKEILDEFEKLKQSVPMLAANLGTLRQALDDFKKEAMTHIGEINQELCDIDDGGPIKEVLDDLITKLQEIRENI